MTEKGWKLVEIADGVTVQDIVEATECEFTVRLILQDYLSPLHYQLTSIDLVSMLIFQAKSS